LRYNSAARKRSHDISITLTGKTKMPGHNLIVIVNLLIALASIGILFCAIVSFIKTPRGQRYKIPSFAEQHKKQLASGELVEIKGQPRKALLRCLPTLILLIPLVLLGIYLPRLLQLDCDFFFGAPLSYLSIIFLCYGLPLLMAVMIVFSNIPRGLCIIRCGYPSPCGYRPPLDTVFFVRSYARKIKARKNKAWGYIGVCFWIAVAGAAIAAGHYLYQQLTGNLDYDAFISRITQKCSAETERNIRDDRDEAE